MEAREFVVPGILSLLFTDDVVLLASLSNDTRLAPVSLHPLFSVGKRCCAHCGKRSWASSLSFFLGDSRNSSTFSRVG